MAALGYEYGCAGLRIWLRRVTNNSLTELLELAD